MNYWTQISCDFANQRNYLDLLYRVYPIIPEDCRAIGDDIWQTILEVFNLKDNEALIRKLLTLDLFPIKDSYVAYLKRDKSAIKRNPDTIARLAGRLYDIGINEIYQKCSEPKETNRQIGPLFRRWIENGNLGILPSSMEQFAENNDNAILGASENEMLRFANETLHYDVAKRPDFIGRFNGRYIIGEAKFLTDYVGIRMHNLRTL